MTLFLNPFANLFLDILYYCFIIIFGPGCFWYLAIFHRKEKRLHNAYQNDGVTTLGVITHRKVRIKRHTFCGVGIGRGHRSCYIRYAYTAQHHEGTNAVYSKDFVKVQQEQLQQRYIPVVILPGEPRSGIPRCIVSKYDIAIWLLVLLYTLALGVAAFATFVFQLLFAYKVTNHCVPISDSFIACELRLSDIILAVLTVNALGFMVAWSMHSSNRNRVPGRVWKIHVCAELAPRNNVQASHYEQLDDREIPMADAIALLTDGSLQECYLNHTDVTRGAATERVESEASDGTTIPTNTNVFEIV